MDISRRTMIAGAAGLPLLPAALDAARPLERRIFVFEPIEGVREILALFLVKGFDVEVLGEGMRADQARALLARRPDAFGAVYWRGPGELKPGAVAEIWSPSGQQMSLPCPFSLRQLRNAFQAVTGWQAIPLF